MTTKKQNEATPRFACKRLLAGEKENMKTKSATPRTDAVVNYDTEQTLVAKLARELEQELNEEKSTTAHLAEEFGFLVTELNLATVANCNGSEHRLMLLDELIRRFPHWESLSAYKQLKASAEPANSVLSVTKPD